VLITAGVWDIWRRVESGSICPTRKFELEIYWRRLKELVREYDIRYNPDSLVPSDDGLIRATFDAGLRLLLDVGILCVDTERIIQFEEKEVKDALRRLPGQATFGEGKDSVTVTHRSFQDKRPPTIFGGPSAAPVSEEMALKIYLSHMKEPIIDTFFPGVIKSLEGVEVKAGSPVEIHSETVNLCWIREAQKRAGRPGMPISGSPSVSVAADISGSSVENGWRKSDFRNAWLLPHMKTDYAGLSRAIHFMQYGCHAMGWGTGHIGGLAGGPEGAAVTSVAETMAASILYQTTLDYVGPLNAMYPGTSDRATMWGNFLSNAAVNTQTRHVSVGEGPYITYAGPCTDMCLYEIAATTIGIVAVGSHPFGVAPRQGIQLDYCTGMESRFMGEVGDAAAGITREHANDLVTTILPKYEDKIKSKNPPPGKRFQECYNLTTVTPLNEYVKLGQDMKNELRDIGLDVN
jgi:methylamine--corrinoid protein Co-methyltransferase